MTFNEWFCALPEPRQAILREDKWMLAQAAFDAGRESGGYETVLTTTKGHAAGLANEVPNSNSTTPPVA